ncbi:MAG: hypothetical protein HY001_03660 [Candidatus Portnoybacteria bacterium]|nr:hypothetical protein [Candidatus Portnoybacteria bacterium]
MESLKMKAKNKIKTIAICCSANFYRQALEIQDELKKRGFGVAVPHTALVMKKRGDYEPSTYKVWYKDASAYKRKAFLIRHHFRKIIASDAILVVNFEKHGKNGYIGGNTLMEMAIAFHYKKQIFVLNDISKDLPHYEEVMGMLPTLLSGDISNIK